MLIIKFRVLQLRQLLTLMIRDLYPQIKNQQSLIKIPKKIFLMKYQSVEEVNSISLNFQTKMQPKNHL
jgi:hypothetical protein